MDHSLKIKKEWKKKKIRIKNKKKRKEKKKGTGDSRYIYHNELDKSCFQHDIAYEGFKYLNKRIDTDKAFNIAKIPKYDGYQCGLASMVINIW